MIIIHYIVLDLEWNQCPYGKGKENPDLPFEVLEIGAVRLNEDREITGTFSETIRPTVYKHLHFRTKEIIGSRFATFQKSRPFPEVAKDFLTWCGEDYIFCTWGPMDLPELQRNLQFYEIDGHLPKPLFYYDVQKLFSLDYEDGKLRRSLEFAVEFLQIEKSSPFHIAFDDTYYTSLVMQRLHWDKIHEYRSVDYYRPPRNRKEEIFMTFEEYTKYVSKIYPTREDLMGDRTVTMTRCHICGRLLRKQIKWFPSAQKQYLCVMECPVHGLQKGKIRIKKAPDGQVFAVKTIKSATPDQVNLLKKKRKDQKLKTKRTTQSGGSASTKPVSSTPESKPESTTVSARPTSSEAES